MTTMLTREHKCLHATVVQHIYKVRLPHHPSDDLKSLAPLSLQIWLEKRTAYRLGILAGKHDQFLLFNHLRSLLLILREKCI